MLALGYIALCALLAMLAGTATAQLANIPCQSIAPACGKIGGVMTTYGSLCDLQKAKASFAYLGHCADPNGCIGVECPPSTPVCGANGITYASRCLAECAKVAVFQEGVCPKEFLCAINCPQTVGSVCDGRMIYLNNCVAGCYGAKSFTPGTCGGS